MWMNIARKSKIPAVQTLAYHTAIETLTVWPIAFHFQEFICINYDYLFVQKEENDWLRFESILEFAQWLHCRGHQVQEVHDLVEWASQIVACISSREMNGRRILLLIFIIIIIYYYYYCYCYYYYCGYYYDYYYYYYYYYYYFIAMIEVIGEIEHLTSPIHLLQRRHSRSAGRQSSKRSRTRDHQLNRRGEVRNPARSSKKSRKTRRKRRRKRGRRNTKRRMPLSRSSLGLVSR